MEKRLKEAAGAPVSSQDRTRARILAAALQLLHAGGRDAVTTRAVAEMAGVQPPVLYRLFGAKDGLLNALAEHGFTVYLAQKQLPTSDQDPVETLRLGWDKHVEFGLSYPALYLLMYVQPQAGSAAAAQMSSAMLHKHMDRVAAAGRLRVPEEHAVMLFHAAAVGIVVTLIRLEQNERDMALSSMARDNTLSMIAVMNDDREERSPVSRAATTLAAGIKEEDGFSRGELSLFKEWLGRIEGA